MHHILVLTPRGFIGELAFKQVKDALSSRHYQLRHCSIPGLASSRHWSLHNDRERLMRIMDGEYPDLVLILCQSQEDADWTFRAIENAKRYYGNPVFCVVVHEDGYSYFRPSTEAPIYDEIESEVQILRLKGRESLVRQIRNQIQALLPDTRW